MDATAALSRKKLLRRGKSRLAPSSAPLGVLWNLSVATESNVFASAEATGAADKIKMDVEVNQLQNRPETPRDSVCSASSAKPK